MAKPPAKTANIVGYIKQPNKLTQACYRMEIPAKRVLSVFLAELTSCDFDFEQPLYIDLDLYVKHFPGNRTRTSEDFHAGMHDLIHSAVSIESPKAGFDRRYIPWVKHVDAVNEGLQKVAYSVEFSEEIRPYFRALDHDFTQYHLQHCRSFKSVNQQRFYECLCQFQNAPSGKLFIKAQDFVNGGIFNFKASMRKPAIVKRDFIPNAIDKIHKNTPLFVTFHDDNGVFTFTILQGDAASRAKANAGKAAIESKGTE